MILIASNRNKNNLRRPKSRKDKSKKKIIIIINVILYNLVNLNEQIKLKLIDIVKKKRKKLFEEIHRHRYKVKHILWEMCYCLVTGVDTGGKIFFIFLNIFFLFRFIFPWSRPPFGECCVCSLSLFSFEIRVVCVGTCVRVCVWAQIWSRHQPWEILRCDWAPTSNRFDLI